ncbi:MAG TPA: M56 family metallopeptidase [Bryobacteraceae bacterium]|nr:M56 family metallopeptidase [Bryobacteraceae bacterium]
MTWNNLLAWSLQIALLVAVAEVAARLLRWRVPAARLLYWQAALLACLALPLVGPWKHTSATASGSVSAVTIMQPAGLPAHHGIPLREVIAVLLAAGILVRGIWLTAGFRRLRQYRRQARWLASREGASLCLCEAVSSPVTFGFLRPVVLLPSHFSDLELEVQEAILCHELLHVRRRDWLFTVGEEFVRTLFWFHPAIWWVLAEIGLAREQEVDRQVVASTQARDQYVDALLAIAGRRFQPDLAPASPFLRKRHLKQRVVSILEEVRMSKTRLVSSFAAAMGVLVAACWLASFTFPLSAAPQAVADGSDGNVIHVLAPPTRQPLQQNTVIVAARVDAGGNVIDAQVLAGPDEVRKLALQHVLNSRRPTSAAEHTDQLSVVFEPETGPLSLISITGVSDQVRADLLARLPVHEGDMLGPEQIVQVNQVAHEFGLGVVSVRLLAQSKRALIIGAAPASIRVGSNVQAVKIRVKPVPVYPVAAKQAGIEGVVKLQALIGKDGTVDNLSVISGHPLLVPSALEAVRQWVYEPTMLNGEPVGVETEIDVNYTLVK